MRLIAGHLFCEDFEGEARSRAGGSQEKKKGMQRLEGGYSSRGSGEAPASTKQR